MTAPNRQSKYTVKKRPQPSPVSTRGAGTQSLSHVPSAWPRTMGMPTEECSKNDKKTWNSTKYGLLKGLQCIQYRNGIKIAFFKHLKICWVWERDLNCVVPEEVKEPRAGVPVRQTVARCSAWIPSKSSLLTLMPSVPLFPGSSSMCTSLAGRRHNLEGLPWLCWRASAQLSKGPLWHWGHGWLPCGQSPICSADGSLCCWTYPVRWSPTELAAPARLPVVSS